MNTLDQQYVNKLIDVARKECSDETAIDVSDMEFNPYDCFGGNMDDAYYGGERDGEIRTTREFLDALGVVWRQ